MTPRERILSVYRREPTDRRAVAIYSRYLRVGEVERAARNLGLGVLDFFPPVSLLAPPWHLAQGYVSEVREATLTVRVSWEEGREVETRSYDTPLGSVTQRAIRDPAGGGEWIQKYYLESPDDYRVMLHVVRHTVFRTLEQSILSRMGHLGEDGVLLGRLDRSPYQKLLVELAGPANLFGALESDPEPVQELLDAIAVRENEQFERALQSAAEVIWQPDNVTADLTPPPAFARHCAPVYRSRAGECLRAGKIYAVHLDGRLRPLAEQIAACGIPVVESLSLPEIGGDLPLRAAKELWPDRAVCPNFPASLCAMPRGRIEEFLRRVYEEWGEEPGLMLQVSEDIPEDAYRTLLPLLCGASGHTQTGTGGAPR